MNAIRVIFVQLQDNSSYEIEKNRIDSKKDGVRSLQRSIERSIQNARCAPRVQSLAFLG